MLTSQYHSTYALLLLLAASSQAAEIVISVGKGGNFFSPDNVTAAVGDTLKFEFYPANHSVVRGSFDYPCIPYEMTAPEVTGFFSGFKPIKVMEEDPPSFSVTVNDTAPIFYYCSAPDSCNRHGMVGLVNANNRTSISDYRSRALSAQYILQPGEPWPSEGSTATPTPMPNMGNMSLTHAGIAGITIGAVAFVGLLVIGGAYLYMRKINRASDKRRSAGGGSSPNTYGFPPTWPDGFRSANYILPPIGTEPFRPGIPTEWACAPPGNTMMAPRQEPVEIYSPSPEEKRREQELESREPGGSYKRERAGPGVSISGKAGDMF